MCHVQDKQVHLAQQRARQHEGIVHDYHKQTCFLEVPVHVVLGCPFLRPHDWTKAAPCKGSGNAARSMLEAQGHDPQVRHAGCFVVQLLLSQ